MTNYQKIETSELINNYFAADLAVEDRTAYGYGLSDMTEILIELDRRGICARSLTPPAWHDEHRRIHAEDPEAPTPEPIAKPDTTPTPAF